MHAIVEQAPVPAPESGYQATLATPSIDGALLFALSASSRDALRQTAARGWPIVGAQGPELARRIWPTPWPAGADAAGAHRRQPATAELTEALREVATGEPLPARGRPRRPRTGRSPGKARNGRAWAPTCWPQTVFAATIAAIRPLIAAESSFSVTEAADRPGS